MTASAGRAVGSRLAGRQASRPKALFVSVTTGVVTASFVYRWLRSGDERD
jgi:hypothetical protein